MLEQLSSVLITAAAPSNGELQRARSLASNCAGELASMGLVAADAGAATTIAGAISCAQAAAASQTTVAPMLREMARGRLEQLGAALASFGILPAAAFQKLTLGTNVAAWDVTTPQVRAVNGTYCVLSGGLQINSVISAGATIFTVPSGAARPTGTRPITLGSASSYCYPPYDPGLVIASTGVVTAASSLNGLGPYVPLVLDGAMYPMP